MKATYPICYPIAKGLDYFLGHGVTQVRFAKKDLKTLIQLHHSAQDGSEGFTGEEIKIINSIIDIRNVSVKSIMVPLERTYKLSEEDEIDEQMIKKIVDKNFSRIPIFSGDGRCRGLLKTKRLLRIHNHLG